MASLAAGLVCSNYPRGFSTTTSVHPRPPTKTSSIGANFGNKGAKAACCGNTYSSPLVSTDFIIINVGSGNTSGRGSISKEITKPIFLLCNKPPICASLTSSKKIAAIVPQ
jgi:hypothetical protein